MHLFLLDKTRFLFIALLLLAAQAVSAQLRAGFTASTVSGCAPVLVRFTDVSTGNPTQWRWELGNGVVSTTKDPSTTYFNPGTYTVKLVIRNASGADSLVKTAFITVHAVPDPAFSANDTSGCFPFPVQFNSTSTTPTGSLTSYNWDFGDGFLGSGANPSHTYLNAGDFSVSLVVTNSAGCSKTITRQRYVRSTIGTVAGFVTPDTVHCSGPLNVRFTNTSTGPAGTRYAWSFGDGNNSAVQNPVHTYVNAGAYTVRLITTTPEGCTDTATRVNLIRIGVQSQISGPANACSGGVLPFRNTSVPMPSSSTWYFGDGSSSSDTDPQKQFTASGSYRVKLVNNYNGCLDSVEKTVNIFARPVAALSATSRTACKVPFTTTFSSVNGGVNPQWDFGDGATGTGISPVHTYTAAGTYTVRLITANSAGCKDTVTMTDYITIAPPVIGFDSLPKHGCVPLAVTPRARVIVGEQVVSYLWNFGDGTTSTMKDPAHTYTIAGNFDITLTITTASGCTVTRTLVDGVRAGNKPKAGFTVQPAVVCASATVQFTDTSTGDCDEWLWLFGDNFTSGNQNPGHVFDGIDSFDVTLIVTSNTCADTLRVPNAVFVKPPLSNFVYEEYCADKYKKTFTDSSIGATSWLWKFGDGDSSTLKNPEHIYATPGTYRVELFVKNAGCENNNFAIIQVVDEQSNFTKSADTLCRSDTLILLQQGINISNTSAWQWDMGDGTLYDTPGMVRHIYRNAGTYIIKLKITDIKGCTDVFQDTVTVFGATAGFFAAQPFVCLENGVMQFTDTSRTDGVHAILQRNWYYGDGSTHSGTAMATHRYGSAGTFTVSLAIEDAAGCRDSIALPQPFIVADPQALFTAADTASCTGKPVAFSNASTGINMRYSWNFGDNATDSIAAPVHQYAAAGIYDVRLIVTDSYGCRDTAQRPGYINISLPKAKFALSDSIGSCPPLRVDFFQQATGFTALEWKFGDGNNSITGNPSHLFTAPGNYKVQLVATGPGGCTDTAYRQVTLKGPNGQFHYDPAPGCMPLGLSFSATTTNRSTVTWDFGDGFTHTGIDTVKAHIYNQAGSFLPRMILEDSAGCRFPVSGTDTIHVASVQAALTANKIALCDSGIFSFQDVSLSNDLIQNRSWNFGNGQVGNGSAPQQHYNTPGNYVVRLLVTTALGCSDSVAVPVRVLASPAVRIMGDSVACVPAAIQFSGVVSTGSVQQWDWNFGNGGTGSGPLPVTQNFTVPGNHTIRLLVQDSNGCSAMAQRVMQVNASPVVSAGPDKVLCAGSTVTLQASGGQRYSWSNAQSLSCADCATTLAAPADSTRYIVTGFNAEGCSNADTVLVMVRHPFQLTVSPGDTLCAGQGMQLFAAGADEYRWFPAAGLDNPLTAAPAASPSSTTEYRVIAQDKDHCFTDTATVRVTVYPVPKLDAGTDITISAGSNGRLEAKSTGGVTSWQWSPAAGLSCATCPVTSAAPRTTTTYKIAGKNDGGCIGSDEVLVMVVCDNGNLFVPNTFSPNGDGSNERFFPRGTGVYLVKAFRIFNRWGEVVFEKQNFQANDASAGWNGQFQGKPAAPGVYVFTCDIVCSNGTVIPFTGNVSLLR